MFVPEPFPEGEKETRNPKTEKWCNTKPFEASDDGVIYGNIEQAKGHKLFKDFFVPLLACRFVKGQIVLYEVVQRPTNQVGNPLRNQPMPVEYTVQQRKDEIAAHEEYSAPQIEKQKLLCIF